MHLRKAVITAIIAFSIALSSPACDNTPEGPGPVIFKSQEYLPAGEIQQRIKAYQTLALWTEIGYSTATEQPERFGKFIFWKTSPSCIEEHKTWQLIDSKPPIEPLLQCAKDEMNQQDAPVWEELSARKREEMSRLALALLWDSINPAVLMSVKIAASQGTDVNPDNNNEFRQFTQNYSGCSIEGHIHPLTQARSPEEMAHMWLLAARELETCAGGVTEKLFPSPAVKTDGETDATEPTKNP